MTEKGKGWGAYFIDLLIRALFRLLLILPYRWRVPLMGWIMARLLAPLAGFPKRISANLAYTLPEMPASEVKTCAIKYPITQAAA